MKKILVILAVAIVVISCNKTTDAKDFKTAYVDTSKLMEESIEAKDIEAKYKGKAAEMDEKLKSEATKLEIEMKNFKQNFLSVFHISVSGLSINWKSSIETMKNLS